MHELLHVSVHKLGHTEISEDEIFIEGFSHILVQIIKQLKDCDPECCDPINKK